MADDFETLYDNVILLAGLASNKAADVNLAKLLINKRYWMVVNAYPWPWLFEKTTLLTTVKYDTGTVTATNGSTTITGSGTTFTSAMVGRKFKVTGFEEVYTISTFTSATEITLDNEFNGTTDDEYTYVIFEDLVTLPSDLDNIVALRQARTPKELDCVGLRELFAYDPVPDEESSDPKYYAYYVPDSNENQRIMLYPAPYRQIVLDLEYKKVITELSDDSDEPLIPQQYRKMLIDGAVADIYIIKRDTAKDLRFEVLENKFNKMLFAMYNKYKATDDRKRITFHTKRQHRLDLQSLINRDYDLKETFDTY